MELVFIVMLAALIHYYVLGALVGKARADFGIRAPATSGHEKFERVYRAHQNTLENLIVFLPAVYLFGLYVGALWAAGVGAVFVIGRIAYAQGYIAAAEKRGKGAMVSGVANGILMLGALVGIVVDMI